MSVRLFPYVVYKGDTKGDIRVYEGDTNCRSCPISV